MTENPKSQGARLILLDEPVGFKVAHTLQLTLHSQRKAGSGGNTLVLLEHTPVITLGRFADHSGVVADGAILANAGVEVHRIERGGQATYHGPGQLVGYPVWKLAGSALGVKRFVHLLEEVMLRTGAALGVKLFRRAGLQGVFSDGGKVGAVGVAVRGGVTLHGFALNVSPDLAHFKWIVPCGLEDTPTTSLSSILGREIDMDETRDATVRAFEGVFSVVLEREPLPAEDF